MSDQLLTPKKTQSHNSKPQQQPGKFILGSPKSLKKPIPHVVFLIFSKSDLCRLAVIRVLLNFYLNVNPEFTWGFEFMTRSGLKGRRLNSSKHAFNFTQESLKLFSIKYEEFVECEIGISAIMEYVHQLSIQCQWNTSPAVPFQSPIKSRERKSVLKMRNYLILVGNTSSNIHEFQRYKNSQSLTNFQILKDLAELILIPSLCQHLLQQRISTIWMQTSETDENTNDHDLLCEWSVSALLRIMGGSLITSGLIRSFNFGPLWKAILQESVDENLQQRAIIQYENPMNILKYPACFQYHKFNATKKIECSIPELSELTNISIFVNVSCRTENCLNEDIEGYQICGITEHRCKAPNQEFCIIVPSPNSESIRGFVKISQFLNNRHYSALAKKLGTTAATYLINFNEISGGATLYSLYDIENVDSARVNDIYWDIEKWFSGKQSPSSIETILRSDQRDSKDFDRLTLHVWNNSLNQDTLPKKVQITPSVKQIASISTEIKISDELESIDNLNGLYSRLNEIYFEILFEKVVLV
jgi:hypothetical protein